MTWPWIGVQVTISSSFPNNPRLDIKHISLEPFGIYMILVLSCFQPSECSPLASDTPTSSPRHTVLLALGVFGPMNICEYIFALFGENRI